MLVPSTSRYLLTHLFIISFILLILGQNIQLTYVVFFLSFITAYYYFLCVSISSIYFITMVTSSMGVQENSAVWLLSLILYVNICDVGEIDLVNHFIMHGRLSESDALKTVKTTNASILYIQFFDANVRSQPSVVLKLIYKFISQYESSSLIIILLRCLFLSYYYNSSFITTAYSPSSHCSQ